MNSADQASLPPRPCTREILVAGGVFTALTVIFTYPLSLDAGRGVLGDNPDTHLFIWTFGWIAEALVRAPLALFDANIFYPLGRALAFSENLVGSGLIAAPVIWVTGNPVLAMNVVSLLSVPLCGVGAYVLARTLGLGIAASFICGIVFAFCPTRFSRLGQLHLTTVQWIPFALAYFHSYMDRGRPRDARLAAAFFTVQALTSGHGAVFLACTMSLLFVVRVATGTPMALARRARDLGASGVMILAPALLVAVPYQIVQRELGLRRTLENWTVPAICFVYSPARVHQAILALFVPLEDVAAVATAYLFPGFLPIALSAAALALPWRGRAWVATRVADHSLFYGLLALVSILLTVGPPVGLWPLVYWLPGFNFIRVPSRFWILATLALAVLSAIGCERLRERLPPKWRALLLPAVATLLLLEFSTVPLVVTPFRVRAPAADRWLDDQPVPFVVAEVPVSGAPRDQSTYMLHSMGHWQPTVHGYSGFEPSGHTALYETMRRFPEPDALAVLRAFNVTYIAVHIDRFAPGRWAAVERELAVTPSLELLFRDETSRVYRLHR